MDIYNDCESDNSYHQRTDLNAAANVCDKNATLSAKNTAHSTKNLVKNSKTDAGDVSSWNCMNCICICIFGLYLHGIAWYTTEVIFSKAFHWKLIDTVRLFLVDHFDQKVFWRRSNLAHKWKQPPKISYWHLIDYIDWGEIRICWRRERQSRHSSLHF